MKPPFHRILPILKGVLVVCGILFLLQVVATFFLKEATTNRFQEINNEVARSQQLGQLDTLSQQLQHSNNHVVGVLSEEGGKGPSTTPADADAVQVAMKQAKNVIIAVLAVLIVGLIGMAVFPPARGDSSRGVEIKEILKRWAGAALTIKNTLKPWVEVVRIIKNILVVIVGLFFFFWAATPVLGILVLFIVTIITITLVYTFLYFFYSYRDSVHGGDGEIRGRMKAKIKKIGKNIFRFCEGIVILVGFIVVCLYLGLYISCTYLGATCNFYN